MSHSKFLCELEASRDSESAPVPGLGQHRIWWTSSTQDGALRHFPQEVGVADIDRALVHVQRRPYRRVIKVAALRPLDPNCWRLVKDCGTVPHVEEEQPAGFEVSRALRNMSSDLPARSGSSPWKSETTASTLLPSLKVRTLPSWNSMRCRHPEAAAPGVRCWRGKSCPRSDPPLSWCVSSGRERRWAWTSCRSPVRGGFRERRPRAHAIGMNCPRWRSPFPCTGGRRPGRRFQTVGPCDFRILRFGPARMGCLGISPCPLGMKGPCLIANISISSSAWKPWPPSTSRMMSPLCRTWLSR